MTRHVFAALVRAVAGVATCAGVEIPGKAKSVDVNTHFFSSRLFTGLIKIVNN